MLDAPLAIANGIACAACLVLAAHASQGRRFAVQLAALLLVDFVICNLGYTEFAPKYALAAVGVSISTKETWAIADAIVGCAAVGFGFRYWYAWAIWGTVIIQELLHGARIAYGLDEFVYTDALQVVLWAQIALFIVIGGPGIVAHTRTVLDRFVRLGNQGRIGATARTRAGASKRPPS